MWHSPLPSTSDGDASLSTSNSESTILSIILMSLLVACALLALSIASLRNQYLRAKNQHIQPHRYISGVTATFVVPVLAAEKEESLPTFPCDATWIPSDRPDVHAILSLPHPHLSDEYSALSLTTLLQDVQLPAEEPAGSLTDMLRDVQLAPLPVTPVQEGEMAGLGTIVAAKGRLRKTVSASGEVDVAAGMEGRSPLMEAKRRLRRAETVVAYDGGKENVLVAEAMVPQWSEAQAKAWAKVKLRSSAAQAAVKREVEQYGDLAQWNCEQVALWFGKEFGEGVAQALIVKGVCGKDLPILTRDDLRTRLGLVGGDIAKVELGVARLLRVHQKGVL